ncbi:unnamed protein product [Prunus armeniaca]
MEVGKVAASIVVSLTHEEREGEMRVREKMLTTMEEGRGPQRMDDGGGNVAVEGSTGRKDKWFFFFKKEKWEEKDKMRESRRWEKKREVSLSQGWLWL